MIKLTGADGHPVYIFNSGYVVRGMYNSMATDKEATMIYLPSGLEFMVEDNAEDVVKLMQAEDLDKAPADTKSAV